MTGSKRVLATAAGIALASTAALADPASLPFDESYEQHDGPDFADVVNVPPIRRQVRVPGALRGPGCRIL